MTLNASVLETWLSAAVAAPSVFTTQPWTFRLDTDTTAIEVRAPERCLRETDPSGRALHLSVGAAVCNLRVAVAHCGWVPVARLLPRPDDPGLLATVRPEPAPQRSVPEHRSDLYDVIWRRHSSRFPFSDRPLPAGVRAELSDAAHTNGAVLSYPATTEKASLLRVTAEAEERDRCHPERAAQSGRRAHRDEHDWDEQGRDEQDRNEQGRDGHDRDDAGPPRTGSGARDTREPLPLRDFTAQRYGARLPAREFERRSVIALLSTAHDHPADWLRAGQALQHVLLVATAHGLRTALLHQAMEWPDLRRKMRPEPDHTGHVHMLVRLGYGPEGPAVPRRAASETLLMSARRAGRA